ncbi:MAG: anti-sigma factor antagonist [Clostridia bacterium]|nr:anti-sigma factor antagonist [Clostridia bacterium]
MVLIKKINENELQVVGRIDSANAAQLEKEIENALGTEYGDVVFDASKLEYVSSAGLRVFMRVKKNTKGTVAIKNVSPAVYEIFDMTGFTQILDVSKALREISIDGCEVIGEGANGKVYRIDEETIIKVFNEGVPMEVVKQERDYAQAAFIGGVPTAISYDVVKCGNCYGAVYEMLRAETVGAVVKKNPERAAELGRRMGRLLKQLHSVEADKNIFTDMLAIYKDRAEQMRKYMTDAEVDKIMSVYNILPDRNTLLHGDFHAKNVMLMDDELIFIDMGDVGYGHPLLDIGGAYLGFMHVGKIAPERTEQYLGMPFDSALIVWNNLINEYFGEENAELANKIAEIYGEAKYTLTPLIYTKATEEIRHRMVAGMRKTGFISEGFDISAAFDTDIC